MENLTVSMVATSAERVVAPVVALEDSDYVLNIKIPFKAMDDAQARMLANAMLSDCNGLPKGMDKLQRVFSDKPPMGISLK